MDPGLCESCMHVKKVPNARGSMFYLCRLSASDARFPRYPRLPVLECAGYVAAPASPPGAQASDPEHSS